MLFLTVLGLVQFSVALGAEPADEKSSVDSSIAKIKVPDGFSVELAAGPPLVEHPTMACFDDRGRFFVCETSGVNMNAEELEEQLPNSIRMLEDTDGDGRFDRSTVFADKMTFPMGAAWHEGALYVASPPNIWRLEDTDGDRVADKREILVGHFGFVGNAASVHGCFLGPDGRLYWCDGYHGHELKDEDGRIKSKGEGSYIFSCWPDGSDVRIHCGGGMDNPVEVDFTDEGEMLGTVNILYNHPRIDCLVHWLYGGAYPHHEQALDEMKITGDVLGPVHNFGHVAISGMMQYRTNGPDDPWNGNLFATYFNNGKVVRLEMERDGSTFHATQREFFSPTIRDFHTTDVLEDADGSLLIINTGGWFYRGCPTSQLSNPNVLGGIYRVRRTDQTAPDDPWGKRIDWDGLTGAQVAARLDDPRFKVRERAIAECAKRGKSIVPNLQQSLQRGNLRERRNALWALTRIVGSDHKNEPAQALIRLALSDAESSIRLSACRSIATNSDAAATGQLLEMVQGDQPSIRREAAKALGRIGDPTVVPGLLAALGDTADRAEEHAIIYALIEINHPEATAQGLTANSAAIQRGALIALDQMDSGRLTGKAVSPLLDSEDQPSRKAALRVFRRHPDWADDAAKLLAHWLSSDALLKQRGDVARGLLAEFTTDQSVASLVGHTLAESSSSEVRELVLRAISAGQSLPLHKSWTASLLRELQSKDLSRIELAIPAVATIKTDRFNELLQQIGSDESRPPLVRVAALEAASTQRDLLSDTMFELLVSLLDEEGTPTEAARAAQVIGTASLTNEQLLEIAPYLEFAGPMLLRDLLRAFHRNEDVDVGKAFLASIETSLGFTGLSSVELSEVVKRYPLELLPTANRLLDKLKAQDEQKLATLDALIPKLKHGNATRGEATFFSEKATCSTCHRIADKGTRVGPDLTTIGANRSGRDLLESVVFPSSSIVRDYEPYTVLTVDGRILTGLLIRETTDTLFIQQQTGDPVPVARDDIEQIAASTVSIMPNGLEKTITEPELADVIAYLRSLQQPPVSLPDGLKVETQD